MNWYVNQKSAFTISNFKDRNLVNLRIRQFKEIIATLNYMTKFVYQNRPETQKILIKMFESKLMSSYPKLKEMFQDAIVKTRDNYKVTSEMIHDIIKVLMAELNKLIDQRTEFTQVTLPKRIKDQNDRK